MKKLPVTVQKLLVAPLLFTVASCAAPTVLAQSAGCSSLIPSSWKVGVAPAPLPEGDTVADWVSFGDAQTGKLDMANGRTKDAIELYERCEARDALAVKKATRRRWFGL